jgi:hypothetical protein
MGTRILAHYQKPDWLTKYLFNPLVAWLTNRGISVRGSRILVVRGRKSGQIRRTPVNPLEMSGKRYLVAPRGETEWAQNLRAVSAGVSCASGVTVSLLGSRSFRTI